MPKGTNVLISDTVGFINKLPHELIQAFRSTLEEVKNADLILHVVDSASDYAQTQIDVVEEVLSSLEASGIPQILVLNKCDKESAADVFTSSAKRNVKISATERLNFDELYSAIEDLLSGDKIRIELVIPYDKYSLMSFVRENGSIIEERHEDDGTHVTALMDEADSQKLRAMLEK